MKKVMNVICAFLAMNLVAIGGGVAWLYYAGHLDKPRMEAIKTVLFPSPSNQPVSKPVASSAPATQPVLNLTELAGTPAAEQVAITQHRFDAQFAQLDRRKQEIAALEEQLDLAKAQLAADRQSLNLEKQQVDAREQQADHLQADKGFQDSLALYEAMPTRQVKTIFMTLDDQTVIQYLQAMPSRSASRIVTEFKTPQELARIQKILEQIRLGQASTSAQP